MLTPGLVDDRGSLKQPARPRVGEWVQCSPAHLTSCSFDLSTYKSLLRRRRVLLARYRRCRSRQHTRVAQIRSVGQAWRSHGPELSSGAVRPWPPFAATAVRAGGQYIKLRFPGPRVHACSAIKPRTHSAARSREARTAPRAHVAARPDALAHRCCDNINGPRGHPLWWVEASVGTLEQTCLLSEGFSILMFIFTMWIVTQNRRRRRLNYGMVGAACAILALSTAVRHTSCPAPVRADYKAHRK